MFRACDVRSRDVGRRTMGWCEPLDEAADPDAEEPTELDGPAYVTVGMVSLDEGAPGTALVGEGNGATLLVVVEVSNPGRLTVDRSGIVESGRLSLVPGGN